MIDILNKLDIKVEKDIATAPYFRMDVEQLADLAEEVLRFYGYDKLETTLIKSDTTLGMRNKEQKIEKKIQEVLVNNGYQKYIRMDF